MLSHCGDDIRLWIVCVESLEQLPQVLWIDAGSNIANGQPNAGVILAIGGDLKRPRAIHDLGHGVSCVQQQVQDHLLELDPTFC